MTVIAKYNSNIERSQLDLPIFSLEFLEFNFEIVWEIIKRIYGTHPKKQTNEWYTYESYQRKQRFDNTLSVL